MLTRETVAKKAWMAASNFAIAPAPALPDVDWEPLWLGRLSAHERDLWRAAADAILALVQPELAEAEERARREQAARERWSEECGRWRQTYERLTTAARRLRAEVSSLHIEAVREGIGSTNAAVLQQRAEELDAALKEGRK